MNALPSNEINKRSPLVVSKVNIPRLGTLPGLINSQTVIETKHSTINTKKSAVGHVQAIQVNPIFRIPSLCYTLPKANPFAI